MTALLVIAILVLLIVIHELGHFTAAKIFGVRVEEFGVGYPPRAYLLGKLGNTEYTLNWIPFGGFVRLFGEEAESRQPGSFVAAPRYVQALILVAGVTANIILAWALFTGAYILGVPSVIDSVNPGENAHLFITDVVPGSPASAAGLAAGDEIVSIKDAKSDSPDALLPEDVMTFVSERGGQVLTLDYVRAHATSTVTVQPANAVIPSAAGRPALGIGLALVANRSLSVGQAAWQACFATVTVLGAVVSSLWMLIRESLSGSVSLNDVVGPVGLISVVHEASYNGIGNVMKLAAFISANLAIINLIPIPALDGGRLVVVIGEAIARRKSPQLLLQIVNTLGIALIIILMVAVTWHDIARLLS